MKTILSIALLTLISIPVVGTTSRQTASDPIQSIRARYAKINKLLARFKQVKKELSGFSAEGGELVAYLDGPAVAKIVATYFGEGGRSVEEYYYWNGDLIFAFRKEFTYDKPLSGKVVRTREDRFYFDNNRLVRWIDQKGKPVSESEPALNEKQKEYLESARRLAEGARSTDKVIEAWQ